MRNLPQRPDAAGPRTALPAAGLSAREQLGLAVLAVERARRGAFARMRRSRLLRWRYRSPAAEELLLAPPDLRAQDPSFADEVAAGHFGLAGAVVNLRGRSPFVVTPPSQAWARELQGFDWLRHLDAAGPGEAAVTARLLVREWIWRRKGRQAHAWAPEVVGRRVISWLSHAGPLLDGAERKTYAAIMRSLTDQVTYLAASWRNAPDGHPRLLALLALVEADLCIAGHDGQLAQSQRLLAAELERQIEPGGGHVSRNPWVLVELLLDLLPLRQCFAARGKKPDAALPAAIARMTAMLRHLRLGDGQLARFNGIGASERDALATVLAYDDKAAVSEPVVRSGYGRLARGSTVLIIDAGPPPPMELAGAACAGCLSFELSTGRELLFVNGGTPGPADAGRRPVARATASHNTLCLGDQSSAKLIRNARLERQIGGPPIRHPDQVTCEVREADGGVEIEASHDGYVQASGLIHTRRLKLDASGAKLDGVDRLTAAKGVVRFAWDVPLAIHFHLHPDAEARLGRSADTAELLLASGERWRLTATGAAVSIEDSTYFADVGGLRRTQQVVLRGLCYGAAEVFWTLERTEAGRPIDKAERVPRGQPLSERLAETSAGFDPSAQTPGDDG